MSEYTGEKYVHVSEQNQWAEPLKSGIGRVLAARLARSLAAAGSNARVAASPQVTIGDPDVRIALDVQRLDARVGGEAVVDALWSVKAKGGASRDGRTIASRPLATGDHADAVRAWSDALADLDRDVAAAVLQVMPARSATAR